MPTLETEQREARVALRRSVGQRLRWVREVLGQSQGEFGYRAGLKPNTYNQIELGIKMPSIEVAIALCDAHGLTLDYIFRGDTGDLKHSVAEGIKMMRHARSEYDDVKVAKKAQSSQ